MSYDRLLEVFGDGSENVNRGLNQATIRSLPSTRITSDGNSNNTNEDDSNNNSNYSHHSNSNSSNSDCAICIDTFQTGQYRKTLPCLHSFHSKCIDKWLRSNGSCPICKHKIEQTG